MKWMHLFQLLLVLTVPSISHASEVNAGFVQGLWYSEETVFATTPTRIYVALRNNTEHDLTATIRFTDNGNRIGTSEVRALSGRLVEAWTDWTPSVGEHKIVATVSDATLHIIGGDTQAIDITGMLAEDTLQVDLDTDKDGTGNTTDTDDDNDDVLDTDEKARGSDPLVPNPKIIDANKTKSEKDTTNEDAEQQSTKEKNVANIISASGATGIEKYIDNSAAAAILSNVTNKVEDAKQSLDTYRSKRNEQLYSRTEEEAQTATITPLGTYSSDQTATITRSKIEESGSFVSSLVSTTAMVFKNIWTFVLFALSQVLGHPALIQLVLLFGILYILYRLIRSVGRRPNM